MLRRLRRSTWNWLPAFLEVAETGSVSQASRQLGLTPAAVSRTLRLLEEELGTALFNRVGRSLALNTTGAALRDAVRSAVGVVDEGLRDSLGDPFVGALRVASIGVLTEYFVMPCLTELKLEHPTLIPEHLNEGTTDATALLLRGQLHVAFYYEDVTAEGILVERLGKTPTSVYCGAGHPLFEQPKVSRAELLEHAFSIPQIGDTGRVMDGWPSEVTRNVGMRITMLQSNVHVALAGALIAVLPDITAAPYVERGELRRFSFRGLPPIDLFAARHESATERSAVGALVRAVGKRVADTNRSLRALRRAT